MDVVIARPRVETTEFQPGLPEAQAGSDDLGASTAARPPQIRRYADRRLHGDGRARHARLLSWRRPDADPVFVLLPMAEYERLRDAWSLVEISSSLGFWRSSQPVIDKTKLRISNCCDGPAWHDATCAPSEFDNREVARGAEEEPRTPNSAPLPMSTLFSTTRGARILSIAAPPDTPHIESQQPIRGD